MRYNRYLHIMLLALTMLCAGCDDFFEPQNDDSTLTDERFFKDESAFQSAMTDVYTQLRSPYLYGGTLTLTSMEFSGQNFVPYDEPTAAAAQLNFSHAALRQLTDSMVVHAYRVVACCNKLIEEAEKSTTYFYTSGLREMLTGEAHAVRAAMQFDLLRLFHPAIAADSTYRALPYVTQFGARSFEALTSAQLLSRVQADLAQAALLLHDSDPIMLSTNPTSVSIGKPDRRLRTFQMNYYAVKAIEARVALWKGDHEQALSCAEAVFAHLSDVATRYQLFYFMSPGTYASDFCFSREFVFGLATLPGGFTTLSEHLFVEQGVGTCSWLRDIYTDVADTRYRAWFHKQDDNSYRMSRKFGKETLLSGYNGSSTGSDLQLPAAIPFIKLGEVALIAAEALNRLHRPDEALSWIARLEQNRDIEEAATLQQSGAATEAEVSGLIAAEYQRDLFGEGQLFYYYKRTGNSSLRMADGTWRTVGASDYVLPLPCGLMQANGEEKKKE